MKAVRELSGNTSYEALLNSVTELISVDFQTSAEYVLGIQLSKK